MKNTILLSAAFAVIAFAQTLDYNWQLEAMEAPRQTMEEAKDDCILDAAITNVYEIADVCESDVVYVNWLTEE